MGGFRIKSWNSPWEEMCAEEQGIEGLRSLARASGLNREKEKRVSCLEARNSCRSGPRSGVAGNSRKGRG